MHSTNLAEQALQCRQLAKRLAGPAAPQHTRPRQLCRVHPSISWCVLHAEGLHQLGSTALAEPIDFYLYLLMLAELLEHESGKAYREELCASTATAPQRAIEENSGKQQPWVDEHAVYPSAYRQAVAHGL